jgi:hypothetical protein
MGLNNTFVYLWRHIPTDRYYIGSHKGTTTDGYITSSDLINQSILADKEDWTREILQTGNEAEMRELEINIIKQCFEDGSCLNQSYAADAPVVLKTVIKPKDRTERSKEFLHIKELLNV